MASSMPTHPGTSKTSARRARVENAVAHHKCMDFEQLAATHPQRWAARNCPLRHHVRAGLAMTLSTPSAAEGRGMRNPPLQGPALGQHWAGEVEGRGWGRDEEVEAGPREAHENRSLVFGKPEGRTRDAVMRSEQAGSYDRNFGWQERTRHGRRFRYRTSRSTGDWLERVHA